MLERFLKEDLQLNNLMALDKKLKKDGLSSYPHPWLMPNFLQFPTVSMGLGPIMGIYQARFLKYLINRELIKDEEERFGFFFGDGEMDEPEFFGCDWIGSERKVR